MKRSFFTNAVILTLTTQLLRVIGLFFISFLSDKICPEGVGLYQLISSVYFLAATFAMSGVGVAVSRLTAESAGRSGGKHTISVVGKAAVFSIIIGLCAAAAFYLLSGFIGTALLQDKRSVLSLRMLSAALPFMALTTCFRGYFLGKKKVAAPASQMIFEQAVQLIVLFSIINSFIPLGLEYSCFAIAVSSVISEVVSFCYGFILYTIERRRACTAALPAPGVSRSILAIAVPVAASSYLRSGLRTAENILIPSGLRRHGASEREALSQFGLIGMVMPVLLFPSSFLTAISSLLLPEIAEANSMNNILKVKLIFSRVFQLTAILSLLFSGIFVAFASDFGTLLYQNSDTGKLLMLLAPLVPLIYLDFIVDSMLNGLNQQMKTLKINVLDYTIRIGLILLFIPRFGFIAYVAIFYISTILNACLSIRRLLIVSGSRIKYTDWVIKPVISIASAGLMVKLLFRIAHENEPSASSLIIKIALCAAFYITMLFITRCVTKSDISWLKGVMKSHKGRKQERGDIRYQNLLGQ